MGVPEVHPVAVRPARLAVTKVALLADTDGLNVTISATWTARGPARPVDGVGAGPVPAEVRAALREWLDAAGA